MKKLSQFSFLAVIFIYIIGLVVLLFQYDPSFNSEEKSLFIVLIIAYFWTAGLIVYAYLVLKLYFFEPILFISVIYELIFVIKPIVDLKNRDMFEHGIGVLSGGVKATILFMIGFAVLFFSYYQSSLMRRKRYPEREVLTDTVKEKEPYAVDPIILYIAWFVIFALCIISMVSQGLSIRYIFSLGSSGERLKDTDNTALFFLANFGATLITLWMMILVKTKGVVLKLVITVLCIIYMLMRNARWLVLIFISAPFVYYYTKRKKSPNWLLIVALAIIGIVVFAWMQVNRFYINTGGAIQGWGEKGFSLGVLLAPFESDLNTYRTFYSMVTRFPSIHSYMYGKTFMYFVILIVPRVLWPGKPDNPVRELIQKSLNMRARISGTAIPNIGELYANFGIVGIIGGMFIVGKATRMLKEYFITREDINEDSCIIYSIVFPLLFQWIARGNFSGNVYLTFSAVLPYIVLNIANRIKLRRNVV